MKKEKNMADIDRFWEECRWSRITDARGESPTISKPAKEKHSPGAVCLGTVSMSGWHGAYPSPKRVCHWHLTSVLRLFLCGWTLYYLLKHETGRWLEIVSFRVPSYICILAEQSETLNNLLKKRGISDALSGWKVFCRWSTIRPGQSDLTSK